MPTHESATQLVNACRSFAYSIHISTQTARSGQLCTDLEVCTKLVTRSILLSSFHRKSYKKNTTSNCLQCSSQPSRPPKQGLCHIPFAYPSSSRLILPNRVHSHAAAALINFCEGVARDTLVPYLDPIVQRLLKLLNPSGDSAKQIRRYVQEQAITTLAMVADASEATFAKVPSHFPSLASKFSPMNTALPFDHATIAECPEKCERPGI
jgi:hypothetical protein